MVYSAFMKKQWQILQPDQESVQKICALVKCNPIIATILVNRNIISPAEALNFLKPSLNNIRPPFSIKDMEAAVRRIVAAIAGNEKILIFGDYDVDGITATTILFKFLRYTEADVSYYIPHRIKEGYGLQINHILDYALPKKINLIITADCGSSSHAALQAAQNAGIDVIVTDHHKTSDNPPPAVAFLNPNRPDCPSGFNHLAGVGVAFYLLISLRKSLRDTHFWHNRPEPNLKNICDLVALGTVADMVPLVDENRILTKTGLDLINSGHQTLPYSQAGIKALIETSGIKNRYLDTYDIAFKLAPRLNAAGRIAHAATAVELLTTEDMETGKQLAGTLNKMNSARQEIEKNILEEILAHLAKNPRRLQQSTLVLSDQESHTEWHEGVLGIVAARLVKKYFRPVALIKIKDGIGKGSARSIPGCDLYDGLLACANDLESFGGHSMAAGLKIKAENLDIFQKNFEKAVLQITKPKDFEPTIFIDYELDFDEISDELIDQLESLKPFGTANPEPLFMARKIEVLSSKIVGENHRQMLLRQAFGKVNKTISAIHFNIDTGMPLKENFDWIIFRIGWNRWNNTKTAQIVIEDTHFFPCNPK